MAPDPGLRRAQSTLGLSALTNLALCLADGGDVKAGLKAIAPALPAAAGILFNLGCLHAGSIVGSRNLRRNPGKCLVLHMNDIRSCS